MCFLNFTFNIHHYICDHRHILIIVVYSITGAKTACSKVSGDWVFNLAVKSVFTVSSACDPAVIIIKVVSTARQYTEPAVQRVSTANQISQRSTWYQISGDKTNSPLVM